MTPLCLVMTCRQVKRKIIFCVWSMKELIHQSFVNGICLGQWRTKSLVSDVFLRTVFPCKHWTKLYHNYKLIYIAFVESINSLESTTTNTRLDMKWRVNPPLKQADGRAGDVCFITVPWHCHLASAISLPCWHCVGRNSRCSCLTMLC